MEAHLAHRLNRVGLLWGHHHHLADLQHADALGVAVAQAARLHDDAPPDAGAGAVVMP
jgi:hypothetical protein